MSSRLTPLFTRVPAQPGSRWAIRNRQVNGSSLVVGSIFSADESLPALHNGLRRLRSVEKIRGALTPGEFNFYRLLSISSWQVMQQRTQGTASSRLIPIS